MLGGVLFSEDNPQPLVILSEAKDLCTLPAHRCCRGVHRSFAGECIGPSAGKKRPPQDDKSSLETELSGSHRRLELVPFVPLQAQVPPRRIDRDDQSDLLDPQPSLNSLFALDRVVDVLEALEIYQPIESVLRGEARASPELMLVHPADQAICQTRIERLRPVAHDVDEIHFRRAHGASSSCRMADLRCERL